MYSIKHWKNGLDTTTEMKTNFFLFRNREYNDLKPKPNFKKRIKS